MILGIDASSVCIGWCILNENETFVNIGHLDLSKQKSLYKKLDKFSELIKNFCNEYGYMNLSIYVEAPLFGSNNQNVVNLLQRWNGIVCSELYRATKKEPVLITNRDALKAAGIVIPKGITGIDRKRFILQYVQNLGIISEDKWALKKTGVPKDFCYDQSDAYVVAIAGVKRT